MALASVFLSLSLTVLASQASAPSADAGAALVVDIPADALYHQPGCPLVRKAGSNVKVMKRADAVRVGLKPHACADAGSAAAEPDPNAQTMLVQPGDNKYHKAGCRTLGAKTSSIPLAEAGRSHWPCPVCKPPIRKPPRAPV